MNTDLLASKPFERLEVEVDYLEEDPPSDYALRLLRRWLIRHTQKPEGVTLRLDQPLPRKLFSDSRRGLAQVARDHARGPVDPRAYYVYVLYAPRLGRYRGVAWGSGGLSDDLSFPVVMMFTKPLRRDSVLWLTRKKVEAAVLIHEFGHVAGLVSASDHRDTGVHCSDPACRMYRGVNARSVWATWFPVMCRGVLPVSFCGLCERDLMRGAQEIKDK